MSAPAVLDRQWNTQFCLVTPSQRGEYSQPVVTFSLPQTEMAGEEELSMLFSNISGPAENIELSLEEIHQILSLPPEVRTRTESLSVSSPESGISISGDFADDLSPWPGSSVSLLPQEYLTNPSHPSHLHDNSYSIKLDQANVMSYAATSETSGETHLQHLQQSQPDMASILRQLTTESSELLLDSEVDLQRLERVKNNFKTTTLISGETFPAGGVTISGPNHTDISQIPQPTPQPYQSVIVRNIQAAGPARPNTGQQFSVDFSSPMVINVGQQEPEMVSLDQEKDQEKDQDIFQNFEIVSPKKEVLEYLCYCCGEKAGKHSYYGGQVCASCRAFFRRSVQSKYYEIFQCKFDKNCRITSQTRKTCQFCR